MERGKKLKKKCIIINMRKIIVIFLFVLNLTTVYSDWNFPIHPSDYWVITSPYGYRISPFLNVARKHEGIDIAAVRFAQVLSVKEGQIIEHWPPPGTPTRTGGYFQGHPVFGGYLVIDHGDGWTSHYAHLSVTYRGTGQRVNSKQVIARIGNTGMAKGFGHHLHFEMRYNGEPVNPLLYIDYPKER